MRIFACSLVFLSLVTSIYARERSAFDIGISVPQLQYTSATVYEDEEKISGGFLATGMPPTLYFSIYPSEYQTIGFTPRVTAFSVWGNDESTKFSTFVSEVSLDMGYYPLGCDVSGSYYLFGLGGLYSSSETSQLIAPYIGIGLGYQLRIKYPYFVKLEGKIKLFPYKEQYQNPTIVGYGASLLMNIGYRF